jgi:hypothetical protein
MPTYSIHHFSALAATPTHRPKGARRIAMSSLAASVAGRSSSYDTPVRRAA